VNGSVRPTIAVQWRVAVETSVQIIGHITAIEPIASGFRVRDRKRLQRSYGQGRWRKRKGMALGLIPKKKIPVDTPRYMCKYTYIANKTIYIRDDDLPVWNAAQAALEKRGESISAVFMECLKKRMEELEMRDGFLHVVKSEPGAGERLGPVVAMFGPSDIAGGAMTPHYCRNWAEMREFLLQLGITEQAATDIMKDVRAKHSASVRVALPQDKIDMF